MSPNSQFIGRRVAFPVKPVFLQGLAAPRDAQTDTSLQDSQTLEEHLLVVAASDALSALHTQAVRHSVLPMPADRSTFRTAARQTSRHPKPVEEKGTSHSCTTRHQKSMDTCVRFESLGYSRVEVEVSIESSGREHIPTRLDEGSCKTS